MTTDTLTTRYTAVAHLDSFWEAVYAFVALKEEEGGEVAENLITDFIVGNAERVHAAPWEFMARTTGRQETAYRALEQFLNDPECPRDYPADLAVWETMRGSLVGE